MIPEPQPAETGRPLNGKSVNLSQLQQELNNAGVVTPSGISVASDAVWLVNPVGMLRDFPQPFRNEADDVIAAHIPIRDKTLADYVTEYAAAVLERKVEIQGILLGLVPPEHI